MGARSRRSRPSSAPTRSRTCRWTASTRRSARRAPPTATPASRATTRSSAPSPRAASSRSRSWRSCRPDGSGPAHRLVAAAPRRRADQHADRLAPVVGNRALHVGVEPRERALRKRVLFVVDQHGGVTAERQEHLFLVPPGLVVLRYPLAGR